MSVTLDATFRRDYGPLVATLCRRFGMDNLHSVEDAVQFAMLQAVQKWPSTGEPSQPAAWIYRVAYRKLLTDLRDSKRRQGLLASLSVDPLSDLSSSQDAYQGFRSELKDSFLSMLFIACDPRIPQESQLVFTLKSLCGFSVEEVASRLFITEANAYKRFTRAKQSLQTQTSEQKIVSMIEQPERLINVLTILYVMFTEGHFSEQVGYSIRLELCDEAMYLVEVLLDSQFARLPEVNALLALMCLHRARMPARRSSSGNLLLLRDQDRSLWDRVLIARGLYYLAESAEGEELSRYHLEARIAAEHCLATDFEETRWDAIVDTYELLDCLVGSPMHALNHAVALSHARSPVEALAYLQTISIPPWLEKTYHWYAVLADLYYQSDNHTSARQAHSNALARAPTREIEHLLVSRFSVYSD